MITDSPINWEARWDFCAPTTLRIPTSLALSTERAVVRLTKLMHAIPKIKIATIPKMYTLLMLPCTLPPFVE